MVHIPGEHVSDPITLTVIIPTLNEGESIGPTIDQIPRDHPDFNIDVMIVDGNSSDDTVAIAESKGVQAIHEPRKGYGRAYRTGFAKATGELIATLDGDMTYPAEKIPELAQYLLDSDLDFITCNRLSKMEKGAMSASHRFGNWALTWWANRLHHLKLRDSQSGMWIFRRAALEHIKLTADGMPLSEEIKIEAFRREAVKTEEVDVEYRPRIGEVKLNAWGDGKINWLFLFSKRADFK